MNINMTKKFSPIALVLVFLLVFSIIIPISVFAATILPTDSFGSSNTNDVLDWVDGGEAGTDDDSDTRINDGSPRSGSATAQHARVGDGGHITRTVDTSGYENIVLKYYWRGDDDGDRNSDNLKVQWKKTSDSSFSTLNTHLLLGNDLWSSEVSVSLPSDAGNTSIDIRFWGDSNHDNNEEGRVDDVSVEGDEIAPSLTLIKEVEGGNADSEDWTLSAIGDQEYPFVLSGEGGAESANDFQAGTYTLSESVGPENYIDGGWECIGSGSQNGSQITLDIGESATCTITNTFVPPGTIVIVKETVGGDGTFNFDSEELGSFSIATFDGSGNKTFSDLEPGIYAVSETELPENWNFSGASCDNGDNPSNIELEEDETVICTFTNTYTKGALIIEKVLLNNNGGIANPEDFSFQVNDGIVTAFEEDGANKLIVDVGAYTVTEQEIEEYSTTYENCEVDIGPGETKTCIITNDDIPAPIITAETIDSPTETSITITWTTDHSATSRVIYDTVSHAVLDAAPNYGYANSTIEDPVQVTNHSVTVTGLSGGMEYFFRTVSHGSPETVSDEFSGITSSPILSKGEEVAVHRTQGQRNRPIGQVLGAFTNGNQKQIDAIRAQLITLIQRLINILQDEINAR